MAGCQSFCDPDDASDGGDAPNPDANWEVFRHADNAFFYVDSDPADPMEHEWRYVNRDMTLSIDQPDEPIGFAFELTYGDDSWEDNIFFWRLVLQYDLPPRPCFTNVDWYVRPRFRRGCPVAC
jgi:hypothetical protein